MGVMHQLLAVMLLKARFQPFITLHSSRDCVFLFQRFYTRRSARLSSIKTLTHGDASLLPAYM